MRPEHLERLCRPARAGPRARSGFGQLDHGGVHAGFKHFGGRAQPGIFAVMRQIGAIATDRGGNRLARFRVRADFARQGQQLERPFEIKLGDVLGDRGALGLLAVAQLDIGPEPACAAHDFKVGDRIAAKRGIFARAAVAIVAALGEFAGKLAFGIVRTRHKCAIAPAAQREPPAFAFGALARIGAVGARGEQVIGQERVKLGGHLARLALHHFIRLRLEIAPECSKHVFPGGASARHVVKLFFHPCGEIIGDVAIEKPFEKRGQQPARFLGIETVLFDPNIHPVLEHLQRRGIGRRPTDAELFEPLDQRSFGIARRRLGEMLGRLDAALGRQIPGAHRGQQAAFIVLWVGFLVAAFFIDRKKPGKAHDLARGAQFVFAGAFAQGDRRALDIGRGHLAGQRALPHQIVKPGFVARTEMIAGEFGRSDRFVRFLRVFGLGFVKARLFGQVMPVIAVGNDLARF